MSAPLYVPGTPDVTPPPWSRLVGRLFHALLPAFCLGCNQPVVGTAAVPLGLCGACRATLTPTFQQGCTICGRPLAAHALPADYRCGACRESPPAFDRLLALWSYQPPLDSVVLGLKFGRLDYLGSHLATALAEGFGDGLCNFDWITPVPLHWRRHLARGYNQAERIARPLAALLSLPYAALLSRRRATPPQSLLGRKPRLANLRRAFWVASPRRVLGRRILLVDDVATTGATLEAAASALKRAGAAAVTALVAGRTPLGP